MKFDDETKYALERARENARDANVFSRSAAQVTIAINGGAASAVLAFISNKDNAAYVKSVVVFVLSGYALGVCLGALTLYALATSSNYLYDSWENNDKKGSALALQKSLWWDKITISCWAVSIVSFLASSVCLGVAIHLSLK